LIYNADTAMGVDVTIGEVGDGSSLTVNGDAEITGDMTADNLNISNWNTAYTHSQDNSQAHSDYLINNGNDETSGKLKTTGDFTDTEDEMFRNVLIGTNATPPTASSYPKGTIYIQYESSES
jgi:hypothetical protein